VKLKKLTLEAWRGVSHREIEFADEVTLIEGPNEVGKSTIVEALHMLFQEMDSSNKQSVKSIQPVGQDVGSKVEVELFTGDYHFVYSKCYNKGKQTSLKILAPKVEQLTGREAHERVEKILDDTIDMALWNSLLVEQGKEIAGAYLADSSGLARALDAAAGTSSDTQDDSVLLSSVQTEYERYFTSKTGKPRYADQEREVQVLREQVAAASASLAEVEDDSDALQRSNHEIQRLKTAIPGLKQSAIGFETSWQEIQELTKKVATKASELDSASEIYEAANADLQRRQGSTSRITENEAKLLALRAKLAPADNQLQALKKKHEVATQQLKQARAHYETARRAADQAQADEAHLDDAKKLRSLKKQLAQIEALEKELAEARGTLSGIRIDATKLAELRTAERELHIALAKRDASALSVEITAEQDLKLQIDDQEVVLAQGQREARNTATELNIHIPGVAGIKLSPSQSSSELENELSDRQARFNQLLENFGVSSLANAVASEDKRLSAQQEIARCLQKIEDLLEGESQAQQQTQQEVLQHRTTRYLEDRSEQLAMPESASDAKEISSRARQDLKEREETVAALQSSLEELGENLEASRADFQVSEQDVIGMDTVINHLNEQLAEARSIETDVDLNEKVANRLAQKTTCETELAMIQKQLETASPEAAKNLLENAQNAHQRAEKDLEQEAQRCAILKDRLTQAQADGRFEALENAEYKLQALEEQYQTTCRRAAAAKRLWETINRHRDSARKAYVKPLKDGLESLGRIVFGPGFEVDLDDQWQLISRTLAGNTIPFEDLSVGTKEQLGILTRLAAARVVAREGGVPLIIDDALGFSDPGRLESMGAAIAAASKECQILLLTCTPGRFMHVGNAQVVRL